MARNPNSKKITLTYYFSVEGETEQWYLKWLEEQINTSNDARFKVSLKNEVQKNPVSYGKKLTIQGKTIVWHLSDIEGSTPGHIRAVERTLSLLKDVKDLGKDIIYKWGYSNLSFDLWMVLHKRDCNGELTCVDNYLRHINNAFDEQFVSLNQYKEETNFKRCLGKLSFPEVLSALNRAKAIMKRNGQDGYQAIQYKGYSYYSHNPSLDLWQPIETILSDCGLL